MNTIKELKVGQIISKTLKPVTRMDLIKYSGASGDFNPIHLIEEEALKTGLPGIIAHGMWTMGNISSLFTSYYNQGFIQEYKARFTSMVFLNDVITIEAELLDKTNYCLHFNISAIKADGQKVINGSVKFVFH